MQQIRLMIVLLMAIPFGMAIAVSAAEYSANSFLHISSGKVPAPLRTAGTSLLIDNTVASKIFTGMPEILRIRDFPITLQSRATIQLHLCPSAVDAQTEVFAGSKRIPLPVVYTYKGSVEGMPGSDILLSYANGDIYGWVWDGRAERLTISPGEKSFAEIREHMLFSADKVQSASGLPQPQCLTKEPESDAYLSTVQAKADQKLDNRLLEMQVLFESTTSFFRGPGRNDATKATEFIIALANAVNVVYRLELNLNIIIPQIRVATVEEPDPYTNDGADTPALLREVSNRWAKIPTIRRDIVHCLDAQGNASNGSGGYVAGIANGIGDLCNGSISNSYSVSGISRFVNLPATAYNNDVVTIAHELGHNMGAAHTHNCAFWSPALDSCLTTSNEYAGRISYSMETCNQGAPIPVPGSIMSYCHLTNSTGGVAYTFLPRVYTFLRNTLEGKNCITEAQQPQIKMIAPLGDKAYSTGDILPIIWTSSRIQNVQIEYTSDGGINWNTIASSIPAASTQMINGQGRYDWQIPQMSTTKARIRVKDMVNPAISDTSWADFSVQKIEITLDLSTNLDGKAFGQKEKVFLQWKKTNVNRVNVLFSQDNAQTWTELIPNLITSSVNADIPDIQAEKCFIRIVSADMPSVISQTGPFSIGLEKLQILAPTASENLCAGKDYVIRWNYSNIAASRIHLQYSVDSGAKWNNITPTVGIAPWLTVYRWTVPALATGNAVKLRALYLADTAIFDISGQFIVSNQADCITTGMQDFYESNAGIGITLYPNPVNTEILGITVKNRGNGFLQHGHILDMNGNSLIKLNIPENFQSGELKTGIKDLINGSYFLQIQINGRNITVPFNVMR